MLYFLCQQMFLIFINNNNALNNMLRKTEIYFLHDNANTIIYSAENNITVLPIYKKIRGLKDV